MKRARLKIIASTAAWIILITASVAGAQPENAPPVASPLVREGELAVSLAEALALGAGDDQIMAESRLGELGISPQNGWIADYPVTPDIVGELQQSLIAAAESSRLGMNTEEALKIFYEVNMELGLSVVPYADESIRESSLEADPAPATVNNYYYNYGPPVVTYYEPPPAYGYLYAWVPFPFWSVGFWFPGFYVLHDFHKTYVIDSRVICISNHYRDVGFQRVYVVDPMKRFHHSGTVYGVGAPHYSSIVYQGNPRVARQVFDINRDRMLRAPAGRNVMMLPGGKQPVRPVGPNKDKPAPLVRGAKTPSRAEKKDIVNRDNVQPKRMPENNRTVQGEKPVAPQREKLQSQVRPMVKGIEPKAVQQGRNPARPVVKTGSHPQTANINAITSRPPVVRQVTPAHGGNEPARIQSQKDNDKRGSNTINQGRAPGNVPGKDLRRTSGQAPGQSTGQVEAHERKAPPSHMKGTDRGGRG